MGMFICNIKIIRKNFNENKIISIIDYKTGKCELDPSKMPLGYNLQLPSYLYLLKKDKEFKEYQLGGFYLQPLLPGHLEQEKKYSYEQTKKKAIKMIGYSSSNKQILEEVDSTYEDSLQIKSLKTKLDGEFMHTAKVLEEKDIETLINLVEEKILDAMTKITES